MPKRRVGDDAPQEEESTPRKTRRTSAKKDGQVDSPSLQAETPSGRKSILKGTPTKANETASVEPTPKSLRKVLFSTPNRAAEVEGAEGEETPTATRNDLSARRKSARVLQKRREDEDSGDEEEIAQEAEIARQILAEGEDADEDELGEDDDIPASATPSAADTPSKRGRPKGRQRQRTPSPPPDLPPHELYFFQNRAGGNKTSTNTLPSHLLLHHEDYFTQTNAYTDSHAAEIARLQALHQRAFEQWIFELEEGFNLCLYGYGSKRQLAMEFAEHMRAQAEGKVKIVVVNGYTPGLTVKDILATLANVMVGKGAVKLPAQPGAMLDLLLQHLDEHPPQAPIHLIIHSLDHQNLRKHQTLIARLAASKHISLLATVDNPNFPLLWDTSLLRQFYWLYHDATTFQPYTAEIDVVDSVNELLGRSGRRLGGRDGVAFVLKSLPENAKALFRILVAEQLANATSDDPHRLSHIAGGEDSDNDSLLGASDDERAAEQQNTPSRRGRRPPKPKARPKPRIAAVSTIPEGVEYRTLYHKAVEEFVCTSELNFRTLLKEFYDHQMVESRRDGLGTERLSVPFGREELEGILEEVV